MRTIDADALTASLKESADRCRDWIQECINIKDDVTQRLAEQSLLTFNECYLRIKKMPTIEPKRIHGRWVGTEFDGYADGNPVYYEWKCSACGCVVEDEEPTWNYCPNCGSYNGGEQDVNC